jgi:uncharacterized membrane-anchored protein
MKCFRLFSTILLLLLAISASAEPEPAEEMTIEAFLSSLAFQEGTIVLGQDLVTLNLPDSFRYLSPEDAEKVLVDGWGNPPGYETLGMIVPVDVDLFSDESWALIISYEEDGYVSDKEAAEINYEALLKEMMESSRANNDARIKEGYAPVELLGWAATPFYDKESHKLHWAKELNFGESEINTLNYNIRILGRKGVLLLNIVADMPQFEAIDAQIPLLLSMTEFNPGNRYADFNPELDKVAAYGIGALIAGKAASKAGLLAKIGGILLVLKKFWLALPLALVAFARKFFKKAEKEQVFTPDSK